MRNKKERWQLAIIFVIAISALALSIASIVGGFRKGSEAPASSGSIACSGSEAHSISEDIEHSALSTSGETSETALESEARVDALAQLYDSEFFDDKEPKDLLNSEEFMEAARAAGMSNEEIGRAVGELQAAYEEARE